MIVFYGDFGWQTPLANAHLHAENYGMIAWKIDMSIDLGAPLPAIAKARPEEMGSVGLLVLDRLYVDAERILMQDMSPSLETEAVRSANGIALSDPESINRLFVARPNLQVIVWAFASPSGKIRMAALRDVSRITSLSATGWNGDILTQMHESTPFF